MTRRLLLGYLITAVVVLLVLEVPLAIFYQQRETGRLTVDVERDATVLAGYYEEPLEQGTPPNPAFASSYAGQTGVRVVIVNAAGPEVSISELPAALTITTRTPVCPA